MGKIIHSHGNEMLIGNDILTDKISEECGVFGIYDLDGGDVAAQIFYGLEALQHRGQESCGIAISDTSSTYCRTSWSTARNIIAILPRWFEQSIIRYLLCVASIQATTHLL